MRSAKLYRYELPMDSGVILREQRLKVREGFIVELAQDGQLGRGEVARCRGLVLSRWMTFTRSWLSNWLSGSAVKN